MTPDREHVRARWAHLLTVTWTFVGIALLLAAGGWLFGKIAGALVPFVMATVIVLLLKGPVAALEKRGMSRAVAVGICFLVGFAVLGVALGFLVPALITQLSDFIAAFPDYYRSAQETIAGLQKNIATLPVPPWLDAALVNLQETITSQSAEWSSSLAKNVFSAGGSALEVLANLVLSLVVSFWVLKDLPVIREEAILLAGPTRRDEAGVVSRKVSRILSGYLKGQAILSLSTGTLVAIGLSIFGVPYALVIGVLAGILNVVPWVGPALTAVIAGVAAAFVGPWYILAGVGVEVAAQQITELFIQPRVMSEQVDLHPLLVIFSLLAGATLFGFTGILLAIPVAAVGKGLFVYYFEKFTDSKLTSEDGALFKAKADADDEGACAG